MDLRCFFFFMYTFIAINFPLNTAFAASLNLWYVVFSFVLRYFLISLFMLSLTPWAFGSVLSNVHLL